MLNILVFKKLDGFEQPWSSAIQNRAQKLKWINFRCLVCRVKLTTLPNHDLNPEAVYEKKKFSQTALGLRWCLGRVVNFARQIGHLKFTRIYF